YRLLAPGTVSAELIAGSAWLPPSAFRSLKTPPGRSGVSQADGRKGLATQGSQAGSAGGFMGALKLDQAVGHLIGGRARGRQGFRQHRTTALYGSGDALRQPARPGRLGESAHDCLPAARLDTLGDGPAGQYFDHALAQGHEQEDTAQLARQREPQL